MVYKKQIRAGGSRSQEPPSKKKSDVHKSCRGEQDSQESPSKKKKDVHSSSRGEQGDVKGSSKGTESSSSKSKCTNATSESEILPKEHIGSRYCDTRVYVPTISEFNAGTDRGSMLDEVSLLPLEDLTSLMCGRIVHSLIKNTALGADLAKACAELQEKHARLDLRAIANTDSVRKRSVQLLRYEGCSDEFLTPSAISTYIDMMLRSVIDRSSWGFDLVGRVPVSESCLSQNLVLARPGVQLINSSFYKFKICQLGHFSVENLAEIREKSSLTAEELKQLLESLQANVLRFFILYCVHGFRDQVSTTFSSSGEIMYKLKYPAPVDTVTTATESDEGLEECIPLNDDYIPCLKDLKNSQCDNGSSLRFQVAHLPVPQIVRLILGEALYKPISTTFPAFFAHLEEYATILKILQSFSRLERFIAKLRKRNEKDVLPRAVVDDLIYQIFSSISDWWLKAKTKLLMNLLRQRLRELKAQSDEQQLWKLQDCDQGSPDLYYPLKRFAKNRLLLAKDLLPRIRRRFNHFFMVYAVDAFREVVSIEEKGGNIKFILNRRTIHEQSCTVNQSVSEPSSSQDAETRTYAFSPVAPIRTGYPEQSPNRCMVSSAENRCCVVPSFNKLVVEKDFLDARTPTAPNKLPLATPADEDWELKFYERLKQDPAVPSYFKTTFGILVANNRDLRAERAFLHNHLNRK